MLFGTGIHLATIGSKQRTLREIGKGYDSIAPGTASYRGYVSIVPADAQFGVSLEAVPMELVGGGSEVFVVKTSNYLGNAYSVFGYVIE